MQTYYVKDGKPDTIRQALRPVRQLYGHTTARDFGPLALKAVRRSMIDSGRSPPVNQQGLASNPAMFRWAAGAELIPGEALASLAAVEPLEKGRSDAKERAPVAPVADPSSWRRCRTSCRRRSAFRWVSTVPP